MFARKYVKKNSLNDRKKLVFLFLSNSSPTTLMRELRESAKYLVIAAVNIFKTYALDTHLSVKKSLQ